MTAPCWSEVPEERLNDRMTRQVIHTETMTIARLTMLAGARVPLHQHPNEQVSLIQSGRLRLRMSGEERDLGPGDIARIPPNVPHEFDTLEDTRVLDLFSPPREDWIRGDDAYLRG